MARRGPEGNRQPGLFPRLLQRLWGVLKARAESVLQLQIDPFVKFLERGRATIISPSMKGRPRPPIKAAVEGASA
jgi:hypothetical protein